MKLINRLSWRDRIWLRCEAIQFFLRYWIGKTSLLSSLPLPSRIAVFVNGNVARANNFDDLVSKRNYARLSPEAHRAILDLQVEQVDKKSEQRARDYQIADVNDRRNDYATAAREVAAVLTKDPSLSPAANVGARVDVVSAFLAARFPNIHFMSVDLQLNLVDHNRSLPQHPNWSFHPGYVIELLESRKIDPKFVLLLDTACKMTPEEVRLFFQLCKDTRAFVIIEAWKPDPMLRRRWSHLTSQSLMDATPNSVFSNGYFFVHNYAKILNDMGFKITKNEIAPTAFDIKYGAHNIVIAMR